MVNGKSDGGQDGKGAGDSITINIGGEAKTLTPAEVSTMLEKAGNVEKTLEGLSGFQKVLTQYGVTSEEYLRNSEAAFASHNSLIAKGIIDQDGTVIEKKASDVKPGEKPIVPEPKDAEVTKQLGTIEKALVALGSKMEGIEDGQSSLYRRNLENDVMAAHPVLEKDDVSRLLAKAQADKGKGFWDHAGEMAQEKMAKETAQVNTIAKATVETLVKVGIISKDKVDLEAFDLNKLKEQDPSAAAPVYENKKFMFSSRKRKLGKAAEDFVAPSEGMKEMLDQEALKEG